MDTRTINEIMVIIKDDYMRKNITRILPKLDPGIKIMQFHEVPNPQNINSNEAPVLMILGLSALKEAEKRLEIIKKNNPGMEFLLFLDNSESDDAGDIEKMLRFKVDAIVDSCTMTDEMMKRINEGKQREMSKGSLLRKETSKRI